MIARRTATIMVIGMLAMSLYSCAIGPRLLNPSPDSAAPLKPGDEIDGVALTTGGANALSLWDVCMAKIGAMRDCQLSARTKLAVGPNTLAMPDGGGVANWSHGQWQLFLDDHPVDLPAFGTFDFVRYHKGHDGQTEVACLYRAWDVVLMAPPGRHTLRGALAYDEDVGGALAKPGHAVQHWDVNFTLVSPDQTAWKVASAR